MCFSIVRVTVSSGGGSDSFQYVVAGTAYGPQVESSDLRCSGPYVGEMCTKYGGITAHASWFSEAVGTTVINLEKPQSQGGDDFHLDVPLGLARLGSVLTYGSALAVAVVGLFLVSGLRHARIERWIPLTGLVAGSLLFIGFIVLVASFLGFANEFRAHMSDQTRDSVTLSTGIGGAALLQPVAAGAAFGMGWYWRRAGLEPAVVTASPAPPTPPGRPTTEPGAIVIPLSRPASPPSTVRRPTQPASRPRPPTAPAKPAAPAPKRPQGPAK